MNTLMCTVGGSHQPIIKAVCDNTPDFVLFICSEDDASGKPGSYEQITKEGIFLKQNREDTKPTLPNIPAQLGMEESSYQVLRVYADDLDHAYSRIAKSLSHFTERGDKILVDYTGGTKTMSAALCLAALDHDEVSLQLVTGVRADLHKVRDGTEESQSAEIGRTRFKLKVNQALEAWQQYAYDDTLLQLRKQKPTHREDKNRLTAIREISRAFSYWDRFNHEAAQAILQNMPRYEQPLKPYLLSLRDICRNGRRQTPSLLLDLWLNTERRASQQRYDDAVARAYRLTEWTAQWLLEEQAGFQTADVPEDKIPEGMYLDKNNKGQYLASLIQSWQLAALHCKPEVGEFWDKQEERLKAWLQIRNHSILAHGFSAISSSDWENIDTFVRQALIPLILSQVSHIGMRELPPQLPDVFIFDI